MSYQSNELEREANLFAMLLLMPKKFIKEDLDNSKIDLGDDEWLKGMAKKYGVTKTAMTVRIAYYFKHKN